MSYVQAHIEKMDPYVPGEQPTAGGRIIKLNTNENPFPPSPYVALALHDELNQGAEPGEYLRLYPQPRSDNVRKAAASNFKFPEDGILIGNGSDELLAILFRACTVPGDSVYRPHPTYSLYDVLAEMQSVKMETVDFDDDYNLPKSLFGNKGKITFISSPNSPSGTLFNNNDLKKLAESLDGLLVVDEAYIAFSARETYPAPGALELAKTLPNVVVVRTLSKSHSLAGMRVGFMFASSELITEFDKVRDSYNMDRLAQRAAIEALKDEDWIKQNISTIQGTRDYLVSGLTELGLEPLPSEANFVLARFPKSKFPNPAQAAEDAYKHLKNRGILVRWFNHRLVDDALRITIGREKEIGILIHALKEYFSSDS